MYNNFFKTISFAQKNLNNGVALSSFMAICWKKGRAVCSFNGPVTGLNINYLNCMLCIKWLQNEPVVLRQFWSSASSIDAALKNDWMDLVLSRDIGMNFDADTERFRNFGLQLTSWRGSSLALAINCSA